MTGRHRAPDPSRLPRREPGAALAALPPDVAPRPRERQEVPPVDLLARVLDGLSRLDEWGGLLR